MRDCPHLRCLEEGQRGGGVTSSQKLANFCKGSALSLSLLSPTDNRYPFVAFQDVEGAGDNPWVELKGQI